MSIVVCPPRFINCQYVAPTFRLVGYRYFSSKRWQSRQLNDQFTKSAKVKGLKSRAAFKLLQINERYHIFQSGQRVVDLGYAPGSWSQVAVGLTKPNGRVLGIDIIPTQPPKGVSTIQGDFLSSEVQTYVREYLRNADSKSQRSVTLSKSEFQSFSGSQHLGPKIQEGVVSTANTESDSDGTVDVVLSDMMMNASGIRFRDHIKTMDLCRAALEFSFHALKCGGRFICKFYQGAEDRLFETQLKRLFREVHREKPESSRSESKEAYFIALERKDKIPKNAIFF